MISLRIRFFAIATIFIIHFSFLTKFIKDKFYQIIALLKCLILLRTDIFQVMDVYIAKLSDNVKFFYFVLERISIIKLILILICYIYIFYLFFFIVDVYILFF
jgi:hypothetical protein